MIRIATLIAIAFFLTTTGSGCFLQPISRVELRYTFIDMDAPALRLAEPIEAELLEKRDGEWIRIGTGLIPAGAYIKGRAPEGFREK